MYYRFKTALFFNYRCDRIVDEKIKGLIEIGIKSIEPSGYHCLATFNDNSLYLFWNQNNFHAWLSDGIFKSGNNSYRYLNSRPSAKTMYLFDKAIAEHLSKTN